MILGGERERGEDNILLHKDKYLSTSRLLHKSFPDDKLSNTTIYASKQKYK